MLHALVAMYIVWLIISFFNEKDAQKRKIEEQKIVDETLRKHAEGMKNNWGRK